ncbi:MAG: hypothetical protein AAFX05_11610 [Planctomycetota bacterium]
MRQAGLIVGAAAIVMMGSTASASMMFGYQPESNNGNMDVSGQLSTLVTDPGGNQVTFATSNSGPISSSIANIYFDDANDLLSSIASIAGSGGTVSFSEGGAPPVFPDGPGDFDEDFRAAAGPPAPTNGVNPGETLTITFDLTGGSTVQDVVDALAASTLRIGVHVISIDGAGSESYMTPTPGAAALLGIAGLGAARRRRAER